FGIILVVPVAIGEELIVRADLEAAVIAIAVRVKAVSRTAGARELIGVVETVSCRGDRSIDIVRFGVDSPGIVDAIGEIFQDRAAGVLVLHLGDVAHGIVGILGRAYELRAGGVGISGQGSNLIANRVVANIDPRLGGAGNELPALQPIGIVENI